MEIIKICLFFGNGAKSSNMTMDDVTVILRFLKKVLSKETRKKRFL